MFIGARLRVRAFRKQTEKVYIVFPMSLWWSTKVPLHFWWILPSKTIIHQHELNAFDYGPFSQTQGFKTFSIGMTMVGNANGAKIIHCKHRNGLIKDIERGHLCTKVKLEFTSRPWNGGIVRQCSSWMYKYLFWALFSVIV